MAMQISINGTKAQTHCWFRGEIGAFDKALKGAKSSKEAGLLFQFCMTIRRSTFYEISSMNEWQFSFADTISKTFRK